MRAEDQQSGTGEQLRTQRGEHVIMLRRYLTLVLGSVGGGAGLTGLSGSDSSVSIPCKKNFCRYVCGSS